MSNKHLSNALFIKSISVLLQSKQYTLIKFEVDDVITTTDILKSSIKHIDIIDMLLIIVFVYIYQTVGFPVIMVLH